MIVINNCGSDCVIRRFNFINEATQALSITSLPLFTSLSLLISVSSAVRVINISSMCYHQVINVLSIGYNKCRTRRDRLTSDRSGCCRQYGDTEEWVWEGPYKGGVGGAPSLDQQLHTNSNWECQRNTPSAVFPTQ